MVSATRAGAAERIAVLAPQVTGLTDQLADHRAGIPVLMNSTSRHWKPNRKRNAPSLIATRTSVASAA